jgi:hypothetical protein
VLTAKCQSMSSSPIKWPSIVSPGKTGEHAARQSVLLHSVVRPGMCWRTNCYAPLGPTRHFRVASQFRISFGACVTSTCCITATCCMDMTDWTVQVEQLVPTLQ